MPTQVQHPFQGAMGTQIVCNGCGFKVCFSITCASTSTSQKIRLKRNVLTGHMHALVIS